MNTTWQGFIDAAPEGLAGAGLITLTTLLLWNRWADRDIRTNWPKTAVLLAQVLGGLGAAAALGRYDTPGVTFAVGTAAALSITAILTDLASSKIPKEPCLVAMAAGIAAYITSGGPDMWGWFNLTAAILGLVLTPFLAAIITKGGLGFGDIRLLAAYALTMSWWLHVEPLLWGVLTACFLQGIVRLTTKLRTAPKLPFGPALVLGVTAWTAFTLIAA